MALNTFNLSNSALSEFDPNTLTNIYPEGTLLVTESGIAYRARKVSENMRGEARQAFTVNYPDGMSGHSDSLPEGAKVVWFPAEEPAPVA